MIPQSVTLELGSLDRWHVVLDLLFLSPRNWTSPTNNGVSKQYWKRQRQVSQQCDPSGVSSIVVSFSLFSYFSLFMLCYFLFCYYKLLQKLFYYYYCYIKEFFSKRNNLSFACSGMFQDDLECFIDAHSTDRNWQTEKRQVRHVSSTTWFQTSGYCLAKSNLTRSVKFGTAEARLLKRALEDLRCLIIYKVSMELLHLTLAEV